MSALSWWISNNVGAAAPHALCPDGTSHGSGPAYPLLDPHGYGRALGRTHQGAPYILALGPVPDKLPCPTVAHNQYAS